MAARPNLRRLFGLRVRALRERAGYSQEGFALHADLDRSYYGSVERGRENVCLDTVEKIARGLAVAVKVLFAFGTPKRKESDRGETHRA